MLEMSRRRQALAMTQPMSLCDALAVIAAYPIFERDRTPVQNILHREARAVVWAHAEKLKREYERSS